MGTRLRPLAAGTGRVIPLSRRVCACLSLWLERFPGAGPDSYLFPFHRIGLGGNSRVPVLYDVDLARPMGSWRHTFISRLAENPSVSEQTIKALAGHVSRQMLEHYSHIRSQAKQQRLRLSNTPQSSPFCRRQGTKLGTLRRVPVQSQKLSL